MARTSLRLILLVLGGTVLVLLLGAIGAAAYLEVQNYRALKATYPQLIQILQAHEAALQKLTGAPTFSLPPQEKAEPAQPPTK